LSIDLHTHTSYSDGSLTPGQLIELARFNGVTALAITDHDEVAANLIALDYNGSSGVDVIPGVELSIDYPLETRGHLHLIGLWIDPGHDELTSILHDLRKARRLRAQQIIEKLNLIGIKIRLEDLAALNHNGYIGRPHIASLLLNKGHTRSLHEAYRQYLGDNCPAYVSKKKLGLQTAINLIHRAGGLAMLAHPFSLGYPTYDQLGNEILRMKETGLDGLEAYNPNYDDNATDWLLQFASKHQFLVSGGSDFHGEMKPGINLGSGHGNLFIPEMILTTLKNHRNS
jgi:predicted metal-dependent phosphoesterase TrpH